MECFSVMSDEIEGRIDPSPYHPIRLETIKKIKSSKFDLLPLKEVVDFRKELVSSYKENLTYIGLENIESHTGKYIPSDEAKTSFGTALKFNKGDVLFPKLRPYLNKVCLAEFDGVCSTEFHVLKVKKCDNMYLFCFLNSNLVVNQTSYLMTGNTLPRLQRAEVENLLIPIPSKEIQQKIIQQRIKSIESRKSKEAEARQLLDSINDYVLDELGIKLPELEDKMTYVVSSEEVKNNRCDAYYYQPKFEEIEKAINKGKFEVKELKEIVKKIKTGTTPHQKLEPFTENKEVIFLRNTNLYRNRLILDDVRYVKNELSKNLTYSLKNDIIICIAGTLGLTAVNIFDDKISINQNISSLTLRENINPHFISAILNLKIYDLLFKRVASLATIFYINNDNLLSIKIPLPPLPLQNKIADEVNQRMQKAEQLQKEAKEELEKAKQEVEEMILS